MTKLPDQAVAKVRALSDAEQDRVAAMLLGLYLVVLGWVA